MISTDIKEESIPLPSSPERPVEPAVQEKDRSTLLILMTALTTISLFITEKLFLFGVPFDCNLFQLSLNSGYFDKAQVSLLNFSIIEGILLLFSKKKVGLLSLYKHFCLYIFFLIMFIVILERGLMLFSLKNTLE